MHFPVKYQQQFTKKLISVTSDLFSFTVSILCRLLGDFGLVRGGTRTDVIHISDLPSVINKRQFYLQNMNIKDLTFFLLPFLKRLHIICTCIYCFLSYFWCNKQFQVVVLSCLKHLVLITVIHILNCSKFVISNYFTRTLCFRNITNTQDDFAPFYFY